MKHAKKTNRLFVDALLARRRLELPVGVCPWRDMKAMIWGYVRDLDDARVRLLEIDPYGRESDETTEFDIAKLYHIDLDETYARRLMLLRGFESGDSSAEVIEKKAELALALEEAVRTGEFLSVQTRDEPSRFSARAEAWEGQSLALRLYDDLTRPGAVQAYRLSAIKSLRRRGPSERADAYLEALAAP